jgi:hypothetical protein
MKKFLIVFASIFLATPLAYAQNVDPEIAKPAMASKYTRPSLSAVSLSFQNSRVLDQKILESKIAERFDINNLDNGVVRINALIVPAYSESQSSFSSEKERQTAYTESLPGLKLKIIEGLTEQNIANEILTDLFIVNGVPTLDRLIARSEMSKTDNEASTESEILSNELQTRKMEVAMLQLSKIYVAAISQYDFVYSSNEKVEGYRSSGLYAICRLVIPEDMKSHWEGFGDYLKQTKFNWEVLEIAELDEGAYNKQPQPYPESTGNDKLDALYRKNIDRSNEALRENRKSPEELNEIITADFFVAQDFITKKSIMDFTPRVPIADVKPIRAKVGVKEEVTEGQRWRIQEAVEKSDGSVMQKHVGYARADNVVDNSGIASGSTLPTEFYQIQGKDPDLGMLMVFDDDAGFEVQVFHYQKANPFKDYNNNIVSIESTVLLKPFKGALGVFGMQIDEDKFIGSLSDTASGIMALAYLGYGHQFYTSRNSQLRLTLAVVYGSQDDYIEDYEYIGVQANASLNINLGKDMKLNLLAGYRYLAQTLYPDDAEATLITGVGLTYGF